MEFEWTDAIVPLFDRMSIVRAPVEKLVFRPGFSLDYEGKKDCRIERHPFEETYATYDHTFVGPALPSLRTLAFGAALVGIDRGIVAQIDIVFFFGVFEDFTSREKAVDFATWTPIHSSKMTTDPSLMAVSDAVTAVANQTPILNPMVVRSRDGKRKRNVGITRFALSPTRGRLISPSRFRSESAADTAKRLGRIKVALIKGRITKPHGS